jgi:hypothetical protein
MPATASASTNVKLAQASQQQAATLLALPLDKILGAPFDAAVEAQKIMATTTANFIRQFGMDKSGNMFTFTTSSYYDIPAANVKDSSGNQALYLYYGPNAGIPVLDPSGVGLNTASKYIASTTTSQGQFFTGKAGSWDVSGTLVNIDSAGRIVGSQGSRSLTLPFLSILNVPALSMTEVIVDFVMTIKTQDTAKKTDTASAASVSQTAQQYGANARGSWWGVNVSASASGSTYSSATAVVSSKSEDTDTASTSSTYNVHMVARDKTPVGLKMMMDFITANADSMSAQKELSEDGYSLRDKGTSNIFNILDSVGGAAPTA